jgi:hypothetical protein
MTSPIPARAYARLQLQIDARLNLILERAARDIQARVARLPLGVGGQIRQAQLQLVLSEIRNIQQVTWNQNVLDTVIGGKGRAALAAEDATETLSRVLYASLPESVADVVRGGLRATALAGIERDVARVPRALSNRVYRDFALTSGQVEATIRSGIIQGLSARELAQSVYQYISPTTPGGASYAASRLARTEINNSFHEMQIKGGQRPGVLACVWNLSGSHGKPDDCNTFASQNVDGLGQGAYKPNNVPGKPHPQCLCFLTYDTMNPAQFEKALQSGKLDADLDARINANLRRLGRGERPHPVPGAPDTSRIDHSGHDHPKTTAARQACKKRLQSVFDPLPPVPKVPPKVTLPKDPHPGVSKLPRTNKHLHGVEEVADDVITQANGPLGRFASSRNYQINCQQVVQAAELRHRGYDVMAKAVRKDYSNDVVNDGWRYENGHKPTIHFNTTLQDIQTKLAGYKDGERAWVMCVWKNGGSHIFNVGVENGRVVWYDAQPGRIVARHKQGVSSDSMQLFNARTQQGKLAWGIIDHVETLLVDDRVLKNVEPFR